MIKNLCLTILICFQFFCITVQGQTQVKNYIPPSPNAMTFLKYGDYPVDYSTGVPSINIPIYTVSLKDFSFPISASFHASGRNTSLNFSPLGLNWALNATGVISREIKGRPDGIYPHAEKSASYYEPQSQHVNELLNLENPRAYGVSGTETDTEYDIFSLSINGISAKFIVRDNAGVVFLTYCPYTLVVTKVNYNISNFLLTDDRGIKYSFGTEAGGLGYVETANNIGATSWFISSITTPSQNTLTFKYGAKSTLGELDEFLGSFNYADQATIGDWYNGYDWTPPPQYSSTVTTLKRTNSNSGDDYYLSYITEIGFDNGKILFTYNPLNLLLQEVKVVSNQEQKTIKDAFFSFYNFLPGTDLALANNNSKTIQNLLFKDENGKEIEKYSFDYYEGVPGGDQPTFSTGKDWWGYANGLNNYQVGQNAIPISSIQILGPPNINYMQQLGSSSCRNPALEPKKVGMIKKIHYPTGGSSEFLYEDNLYDNIYGVQKIGPGIRVKQIISDDGKGNQLSKVYKYGVNENGSGTLLWEPSPSDYYTLKIMNYMVYPSNFVFPYDFWFYRWRIYSSEPCSDLQQAIHLPVYYSTVTEYNSSIANLSANGRTVYNYSLPSFAKPFSSLWAYETFYVQSFQFDCWSTPRLASKLISKFDVTSGQYKLQSSVVNGYTKYNEVIIPQATLYRFHEFPEENNTGNRVRELFVMTTPPSGNLVNFKVFTLLDKPIVAAVMKLAEETTTSYDENGNQIGTVVSYEYNNLVHLNPTGILGQTSDNKKSATYISYNGIYPEEKIITKSNLDGSNATILSGEIYTYVTNGIPQKVYKLETSNPIPLASFKFSTRPTGVLPSTGTTPTSFLMDSRYKLNVTYSQYDSKFNPLQINPEANAPISYIWGYNKMYPVAQVAGAEYATAMGYINQTVLDNPLSTDADIRTELNRMRMGLANTNALVTTYTYKPLVGMTSQTDPNGRTSYYSYDAFNRLQLIRDQDGKVIKTFCYNYAGQQTDCSVNVTPSWIATGNLRCATSAGVNTGYQEAEQRDNNPNSSTFNQTQWVSNGYNTSACPLPAATCSISISSGYSLITSSISSSGSTASFYMAFYPTASSMQPGISYFVGTINGSCKPSGYRTINTSSSGGNWTITIYPSGEMYWYLSPGSSPVSQNSTVYTSTLTYNL